jgi:uncharacterized protein (DUF2249 family)
MITKDVKISKLLKEYPGSLDILLQTSPHFNKLKNKVLRKALAGRVTIEQAASIAGVDLNNLLSALNHSRGNLESSIINAGENEEAKANIIGKSIFQVDKPAGTAGKPEYLKSVTADKMSILDVRPIIDSGKDPLKDILLKIKELNTGKVLVIKNSFEPIPLYTLLGKKGFLHWTEKRESDSHENSYYEVYFYKGTDENIEESLSYDSSKEIDENDFENIIEVDVHELQPPEPMMKILENLNRVDEKTVMKVFHHREPVLLYPKLEERGYHAFCRKIGNENYKILIARKKAG